MDMLELARAVCAPHVDPLAAAVDRLGMLRAQIAQLEADADKLRAQLEAAGLKHIDGTLYRATMTECAGRTVTDWKTIAARLGASPQLVRAYTKTTEGHMRLTITARA